MPEYERSTTVTANPDDAFRTLSDAKNLPRYIATMTRAQPAGSGTLHVAADVEGRHEEGDASFRADPGRHRMEWGGEDGSSYRGTLQVSDAGNGSSVTIHLHVPHEGDEAEINQVLDQTVSNIQGMFS
jgi:Polyketide cyclase / dehydrase and lipid transport